MERVQFQQEQASFNMYQIISEFLNSFSQMLDELKDLVEKKVFTIVSKNLAGNWLFFTEKRVGRNQANHETALDIRSQSRSSCREKI